MAKRQARSRPAQAELPGVELRGLQLHGTAARIKALLEERERLLREVNKKKRQAQQVRTVAQQEAQATATQIAPLIQRHQMLRGELTALFNELLSKDRLSTRAHREVLKVRRALELQGVLSPSDGLDDDDDDVATPAWNEADPDEPWSQSAGRDGTSNEPPRSRAQQTAHASAREVASAHKPGQEHRSLRHIFRSLARAVHPDRARQEPERERRTEVMKEITRAYEEGDLARLLELESAWQSERVLAGDGDPEARCRELERINRELLTQVRQLTRELRDVKRDAKQASLGPLREVVAQATRELDELASICEFVRRFRDKKCTLAEFVRGPLGVHGDEEDDLQRLLEGMLMDELGYVPARPPPARKGRRPRAR